MWCAESTEHQQGAKPKRTDVTPIFSVSLIPLPSCSLPGDFGGEVMLLIDQSGCTNKAVRPC